METEKKRNLTKRGIAIVLEFLYDTQFWSSTGCEIPLNERQLPLAGAPWTLVLALGKMKESFPGQAVQTHTHNYLLREDNCVCVCAEGGYPLV